MEPECSLLCRVRGDKPGLREDRVETARWLQELGAANGQSTIIVKPDPSRPNPFFELQGGPWTFRVAMP